LKQEQGDAEQGYNNTGSSRSRLDATGMQRLFLSCSLSRNKKIIRCGTIRFISSSITLKIASLSLDDKKNMIKVQHDTALPGRQYSLFPERHRRTEKWLLGWKLDGEMSDRANSQSQALRNDQMRRNQLPLTPRKESRRRTNLTGS